MMLREIGENTANILVVEDDPELREALNDTLSLAGYAVQEATDGKDALRILEHTPVELVVSDVQMEPMDGNRLLRSLRASRPELPVVLMTAFGTIDEAVTAMRDGASDYLVKPFESGQLLSVVEQFAGTTRSEEEEGIDEGHVIAVDPKSVSLLQLARRVAASEATVMIVGESGTGKEVIARYVHEHSTRCNGPFVAINCAAIPESMLEAILFGHEKGAFTGAVDAREGKFEQANGGTLLLDEITEMELGLQAKLLRVLQEKEVERIGGRKTISLNLRVIATSNCNLKQAVSGGSFREDLYYRLNVFPLQIEPLEARRSDILPLARRFAAKFSVDRSVPEFNDSTRAMLLAHDWPGNVRELENVIQRAMILCDGDVIDETSLNLESSSEIAVSHDRPNTAGGPVLGRKLKDRESELILETLRALDGSRKRTAQQLGISPRTLRYKLARLRDAGVEVPR